jgi:glycosyltransferase involved in cell wall biosynthesis
MKALLITQAKVVSGAEMITKQLYDHANCKLVLASGNPLVLDYFANQGFETVFVPNLVGLNRENLKLRTLARLPASAVALQKAIKDIDPDYIHLTNVPSLLYTRLALKTPTPVLLHVHDHYLQDRFVSFVARQLKYFPRRVICVSRGVQEEILTLGFDKSKVKVIYNGIAFSQFDVEAKLARRPSELLRLIFVGLLTPAKGLHILLETLTLLPQAMKSRLELSVVGQSLEPNYKEKLHALARASGVEVHFIGKQLNARQWIFDHDILIHCSLGTDSFPTVVLEGMHEGCAVIGAKHTGAKEMIEDGVTGLLVDVKEPQQLYNALFRLLQEPDLRQHLATSAYQQAKQNLGLETFRQHFFNEVETLGRMS